MDVQAKVIEIIKKSTNCEIDLNDKFYKHFDSLEYVELIMEIEDKLHIEFCDAEVPKVSRTKIKDLLNLVENKYNEKTHHPKNSLSI